MDRLKVGKGSPFSQVQCVCVCGPWSCWWVYGGCMEGNDTVKSVSERKFVLIKKIHSYQLCYTSSQHWHTESSRRYNRSEEEFTRQELAFRLIDEVHLQRLQDLSLCKVTYSALGHHWDGHCLHDPLYLLHFQQSQRWREGGRERGGGKRER